MGTDPEPSIDAARARQARLRRRAPRRRAVTATILSGAVLAAAGSAASAQDASAPCRVTRLAGTATLLHADATSPVGIGTPVSAGDRVDTGPGAQLEIGCRDGSLVTLGEDTRMSLAIFQDAQDRPLKRLLRLVAGILRLRAADDDTRDRFEVMTETAIASVRSTHWIVDAGPKGTAVFVEEGSVAASARDIPGAVILEPGFGTDIARGKAPTPPKRWGQARIDAAFARTTLP